MTKWNYLSSFVHLTLSCIAGSVSKADTRTRVETQVRTRVEPLEDPKFAARAHQLTLDGAAVTLGRAVSAAKRAVSKMQADGKLRYQGPKMGSR